MYKHILIPLENSPFDAAILDHVRKLARLCGSRLTLMHVADGWAARNLNWLNLRESDEIREDREYLEKMAETLRGEGFEVVETILALGEPANEILAQIDKCGCDLVAMATHGHRFLSDFFRGSTVAKVRHLSLAPVLLLRGHK